MVYLNKNNNCLKALIAAVIIFISANSQAQTLKEWLRQKKTQKEYLLTQIAANQLYFDLLKKGYRIVHAGIDVVGDLQRGEFHLHDRFFGSLIAVNPSVRRYARVPESLTLELQILSQCARLKQVLKNNTLLRTQERTYIDQVVGRVIKASEQSYIGLLDLLEDGKMNLRDHERITRLQQIHKELRDQHEFVNGFSKDIQLLIINRERESKDMSELLKLNNLMH
jgi:hypothetical protein